MVSMIGLLATSRRSPVLLRLLELLCWIYSIFFNKGFSDLKSCLDWSYHHARSCENFNFRFRCPNSLNSYHNCETSVVGLNFFLEFPGFFSAAHISFQINKQENSNLHKLPVWWYELFRHVFKSESPLLHFFFQIKTRLPELLCWIYSSL